MLVGTNSWVLIRRRLWKQWDLLPRTAPTCPCTATGSRHQSVLHFSRLNASHGLRQPISANPPNFRGESCGAQAKPDSLLGSQNGFARHTGSRLSQEGEL